MEQPGSFSSSTSPTNKALYGIAATLNNFSLCKDISMGQFWGMGGFSLQRMSSFQPIITKQMVMHVITLLAFHSMLKICFILFINIIISAS